MRAIQVTGSWADGPREVTVDKPPAPSGAQIQLRMQAVGLHAVVRARAAGVHYSASTLPHTVGVDGVGLDEATGLRYYVMGMTPDFGTCAEYVNVPRAAAVPIPPAVDSAALAANVNPGMSSWLALTTRTTALPAGFTVLIIGATSASGQLAVPLSRALGAGRVIGVARNAATLADVAGLDLRIAGTAESDFTGLDDVDVVLDSVGGDTAVQVLRGLPARSKPVQFVQIGILAGQESIHLPIALLRSKNLTLRGSGPGAWTVAELGQQLPGLVKALCDLPLKQPQTFPLDQFATVWEDKEIAKKGRVVLTL